VVVSSILTLVIKHVGSAAMEWLQKKILSISSVTDNVVLVQFRSALAAVKRFRRCWRVFRSDMRHVNAKPQKQARFTTGFAGRR
jgi:hypothetical protein